MKTISQVNQASVSTLIWTPQIEVDRLSSQETNGVIILPDHVESLTKEVVKQLLGGKGFACEFEAVSEAIIPISPQPYMVKGVLSIEKDLNPNIYNVRDLNSLVSCVSEIIYPAMIHSAISETSIQPCTDTDRLRKVVQGLHNTQLINSDVLSSTNDLNWSKTPLRLKSFHPI